eukprot:35663_1
MASESTKKTADIIKLRGTAQNYAWGKPAKTSKVAQLLGKDNDGDNPYAELWMGTHKKGPSSVILDSKTNKTQLLSDYIGNELPYLYKVLSVARSLSIQAHPNKQLAKKLNSERPNIYKDDNHKPEMAIALTQFEAMCGFRPSNQIVFFLKNIIEFNNIIGKNIAESFINNPNDTKQLQNIFTAVMTADKNEVKKQINTLINRLKNEQIPAFAPNDDEKKQDNNDQKQDDAFVRNININELVPRLNEQYPGDVGIFAVFLLNCFRLQPGEAIFLEANLPHAYLDGDCLECMACSDNVVRAGLTPKLRDTDVLCEMLNYKAQNPVIMNGNKISQYTFQYKAGKDINEFRLDRTVINGKNKECLEISKIEGCGSKYAAIVLVYEGNGSVNGMDVIQGDCLLVSPDVDVLNIENKNDGSLKLARCYAPSS